MCGVQGWEQCPVPVPDPVPVPITCSGVSDWRARRRCRSRSSARPGDPGATASPGERDGHGIRDRAVATILSSAPPQLPEVVQQRAHRHRYWYVRCETSRTQGKRVAKKWHMTKG